MPRSVTNTPAWRSRRSFLHQGSLFIAAHSLAASVVSAGVVSATSKDVAAAAISAAQPLLRIGLVTDLHYADKSPAGSRHYRETLRKLDEAASKFQELKTDFLVELGDFIDAADSVDVEKAYLKRINDRFSAVGRERHYVLGNHCVDTLTKQEFLAGVEQAAAYYSFDRGPFHFVVLDACFRADQVAYGRKNSQWNDANIPPAELEWLVGDLEASRLPTVVFVHQRLDVENDHGIKNAAVVRECLEKSGHVLAVFQGHSHQNDLNEISGIPYCTLAAMVEGAGEQSNGYSVLNVHADGTLQVTGFRRQATYRWNR